jgi:tripartite-type tricarboxylate transporter receptor subunit TctC
MRHRIQRAIAGLAGVALGAGIVALGSAASAQTAEEFYRGKTITYIVSTSAGGGYDTYARLIAKHMEDHLPGTKVIIKNVAGAGHIIGTNQLYASKPDGLTIGSFNTGLVYAQLLGQEGIRFDLSKLTWIGKAASDARVVMVSAKGPIMKFDDLRTAKEPVKFGGAGPGSASYNEIKMLIEALNLNIEYIPGYSGREDEMAILRGELGGSMGSLSSFLPFVKNGYGRLVLQIGSTPPPEYPDTPLAKDTIKDPAGRSIAALIASQAELSRLTAAPPGVPEDRANFLIAAYKATLEDPALIKEAEKLDRPIDPLYGEDVKQRIVEALDQPPEMLTLIKAVIEGGEAAAPKAQKLTSELTSVSPDGRNIEFAGPDGNPVKSKVSGSRTKVVIAGQDAKRDQLKAGMKCDIEYMPGDGNEPSLVSCP